MDDESQSVQGDAFTVWVNRQPKGPGQLGARGAVLKTGRQVAKTVTYSSFGDTTTGEVKKRELSFRTVPRNPLGPGYDFDNPSARWSCENNEVDRLLAFLGEEVKGTGRYRLVDTNSSQIALMELLSSGDVDAAELVGALLARGNAGEFVQALSQTAGGLAAAESAVLAQRRELVARLRELSEDPDTTETDMQRAMGESYWLFGGRYVGIADRRNLVPLDQYDIPLVHTDGALHIVELKGPYIPRLVRLHRNHPIVGNDVHEAVSQVMNYLGNVDEHGLGLTTMYRNNFGLDYDMHRVFATVVIGHPLHVDGFNARQVEQTLRTYNSHLSRVEVLTWAMLLDAAERALEFEQETVAAAQEEPPPAAEDPWSTPPASAEDPWSAPSPMSWGDEPPF
jgi:hypothetical protein